MVDKNMSQPLNYRTTMRPSKGVIIAISLFTVVCIIALAIGIWRNFIAVRTMNSSAGGLDTYFAQSKTVLINPVLDDVQRTVSLISLVENAKIEGVLPLRTPWPSNGEIEIAMLLEEPEVAKVIGLTEKKSFQSYLQTCYPTFHVDVELKRREWERTKGQNRSLQN
jgi:hypothetical protein